MKKILIVGSGISGLSSAYFLRNKYKITILEKNNYIGGHTHTHTLHESGKKYQYDSGFIVFNNKNYPNFINLINKLKIDYQLSEMSFSVINNKYNYEWSGRSLKTIFSLKNIVSLKYLKLLYDIIRFSKICGIELYDQSLTVQKFLKTHKFSKEFSNLYFYPMCSSIWSSNLKDIKNYNAKFVINFFRNHGLHNIISKRPIWYTIKNGSKSYIEKITKHKNIKLILDSKVILVDQNKKIVKTNNRKIIKYDHIILANHSNEIKKILKNQNDKQKKLLKSVKYQSNKIIIHSDEKMMPKKKSNWASWNFNNNNKKLLLTYWMNLLQNLKCKKNIFVTLNSKKINRNKIIKKITYEHPIFNKSKDEIEILNYNAQGFNNTWFAGAWLGYGFHEDGVKSALKIKELIND